MKSILQIWLLKSALNKLSGNLDIVDLSRFEATTVVKNESLVFFRSNFLVDVSSDCLMIRYCLQSMDIYEVSSWVWREGDIAYCYQYPKHAVNQGRFPNSCLLSIILLIPL